MTAVVRRGEPLAGLTRFCYRRRRLVLVAWIVGTVLLLTFAILFAAPADNNFAGGNSESGQAQALIQQHFPRQTGPSLTLVVRADGGVNAPAVRSQVDALVAKLSALPHVTSVRSPYDGPGQISPDERTAFATVQSDEDLYLAGAVQPALDDARSASSGGVRFAVGGGDVVPVETPYGGAADGIGGTAAMVIILIAFGSLLAMGLTMAAALFGIATGMAVTMLLGHLVPAPGFSPVVSTLLGLGVGIDYALLIVTRYREGLAAGADPEQSVVTAIATAGRSVLFAGCTVVIAMLGLFVMQQKLLNATAVAACVAVLFVMVSAITVLPALLGFAGRNIDRLRLPYLGRTGARSPMAERWARVVQRRPAIGFVVGAVVMLVLAAPALSMRLGFEDNSTEPHNTSGYTAHRLLTEGFGAGYDAPLLVVAELPHGAAASGAGAGPDVTKVLNAVGRTAGIANVTPPQVSADGVVAMFVTYPTTSVLDARTTDLVHRLRDSVIPAAAAGTGMQVHVGGPNAGTIDSADAVYTRLPWLIAVVVALSLIVILLLVRSVVIAVKAAVMTLLSVAASYGVLTAIVQWGWLSRQLGLPTPMPITFWVPLFMFPILFGLSTDYEVFLISRIREEYDAGVDTRTAVTRGLSHTARVITAAAAIMVTVFLSVLATPEVAVKMFGLGLGIAVLLDATVVRMVLVPSAMELLGAANWWLPRPLDRLLPNFALD